MRVSKLCRVPSLLLIAGCFTGFSSFSTSIHAQISGQTLPSGPPQNNPPALSSAISGTILDTNGNVIEDASIRISMAHSPGMLHEMKSGALGQFEFTGLTPGTYVVTVSHIGMATFVSKPIALIAEKPVIMSNVVLQVAGATTTVTVMSEEAASASIEQVEIAKQQRVFKVFPNFYSSFDWNAPPMMTKQKYGLAARTLVDPVTFLTTAAVAGVQQYRNVFPSFGSGIEGYGKRYAAAYADHASGELLTRAVFPVIFHSDPRYFVMGKGRAKTRAGHAIASTFMTRGDDGVRMVNFPEILGDFSAAGLSNLYFPEQERGMNLVLINGIAALGGDMLDNLIREFVVNHLTSRAKH